MKKKDLIFGIHAVLEAIERGKSISKIWIKHPSSHSLHKKISQLSQQKAIPISHVPMVKLNRLISEKHQGVIALVSPIVFSSLSHVIEATYERGEIPFIIVLSRIEDTRNLGAIVRTALAAQVHAVVLPLKEIPPIDGTTMKTSAGTLSSMPICRVKDLGQAITFLKESGIQVVACTEKAQRKYYSANFELPTALLLGGEAEGIAAHYLVMSNHHITIPMNRKVNSLNVAVATGIISYEVVRQRTP
ncbi:MAG: 23S rRNA (guanosine(2251)-2'-O)-methyltransferase RlmB [Bacteroidota bacterium]